MKKVTFLLATLLVGGLMFTGCKKDNPTPTPTPTPTPSAYTVTYKVLNTMDGKTMSPCFKLEVTYVDANGQSVTENNVTLPWMKSIEVKAPFHAKMEGTFSYNEQELPESVIYGRIKGIIVEYSGGFSGEVIGNLTTYRKENFLSLIAEHPERLKFTEEKDIQ